jgi:hypothetical protein
VLWCHLLRGHGAGDADNFGGGWWAFVVAVCIPFLVEAEEYVKFVVLNRVLANECVSGFKMTDVLF